MRRRLLSALAIVTSAVLMTTLSLGFSVLELLGWAVFFATLFWPLLYRQQPGCRLPRWLRRRETSREGRS